MAWLCCLSSTIFDAEYGHFQKFALLWSVVPQHIFWVFQMCVDNGGAFGIMARGQAFDVLGVPRRAKAINMCGGLQFVQKRKCGVDGGCEAGQIDAACVMSAHLSTPPLKRCGSKEDLHVLNFVKPVGFSNLHSDLWAKVWMVQDGSGLIEVDNPQRPGPFQKFESFLIFQILMSAFECGFFARFGFLEL